MAARVAVMLDGGFVKKKLQRQSPRALPDAAAVVALTLRIMDKPRLSGAELLRAYFYDAPPLTATARNPMDGAPVDFSRTRQARENQRLLDQLELMPDVAVRRGTLSMSGWKLGRSALHSIARNPRPLTPQDIVPDISQKGVDLRIGLDIALMSLKRLVDTIVLVSGDSDLVPAMEFARNERVRVYLETMGHPVRRELRAHADFVL